MNAGRPTLARRVCHAILLASNAIAIPIGCSSRADEPAANVAPGDDAGTTPSVSDSSIDADAGPTTVHLTPFDGDAGTSSIADALESNAFLYIPPGDYTIDRAVKISGRRGGVILGAGRGATRLHFTGSFGLTIEDSQDLLIGNMQLDVATPSIADTLIDVGGTAPSQVSFLALLMNSGQVSGTHVVGRTSVRVDSPSDVMLQGVHINGSDAAVLVDDPGANVHLLGGNHQSNNTHVHQKRGHLDMRAVGVQVAYDQDVVIESAATTPHVVEAVRSEGPYAFLVVPPTADAVDVLASANSVTVGAKAFDYGAHGTLWLVNNNMKGNIVASAGAVKSFGNAFDEGSLPADHVATPPFAITAPAVAISVGDILAVKNASGTPYYRSMVVAAAAFTAGGLPAPAQVTFPQTIAPTDAPAIAPPVKDVDWPYVDNLADLMPSVKSFGAIGDGVTDDTAAIAKALAASRQSALYFPTGTYRVSTPLLVEHWFGSSYWGEGYDKSRLVNVTDDTVFRTNGCGYTTFIGLSFETHDRGAGKPIDLSWDNTSTADSLGGALQANMFYRVNFQGGTEAVSIGAGGFMGSEHLFVHSRFAKSAVGLAVHNYNALSDVVVDSDFSDVDVAAEQNTAGNFHLYGDRFDMITHQGIQVGNTAWDTFVVRDSTWNQHSRILGTGFTGARITMLVSNVVFTPLGDPADSFAFAYGAGGSLALFGVDLGDRTVSAYSSADGDGTVVALSTKTSLTTSPYGISNAAHLFQ